jgi:phosphate transport system substrate-binding protein
MLALLRRSAGRMSSPVYLIERAFILKGFVSRRTLITAAAAMGTVGAFGGVASSNAFASGLTLRGAGSTLVQPLEAEWATGYNQNTGNTIVYSGVGSGTGITDISNRLVDFGASDAPLTPTQAAACNNCVQMPWALTGTGVGYNIPGVSNLKLTGSVLASIYLGQITNWSDPQIKKLNPKAKLPNLKITPIFRSDGSGDTYAFTNYLSDVSKTWASKVNFATSVQFPTGVGASGNSGVASLLGTTSGGIAYAAVSYLIAQKENAAAIQNAAGNYEVPNLNNIENAAASVKKVPGNNELHIVDPPKSQKIAYPISTFTYVIVPKTSNKQLTFVRAFVNYAIGAGQAFGPRLDFAPLPKVVLKADKKSLAGLS